MCCKRQSLMIFVITCMQLVLSSCLGTSSPEAENPVSSTIQIPKVSIIKDGIIMEVFLRFSPNGMELVRIPQFGPVLLSDTGSYKKARTFSVGMRMVAYSPDGTMMATAEGTDGARIWDTAMKGKQIQNAVMDELYLLETPLQILQAPSKDPTQRMFWIEFSPDGKRLISTQANGHVKVWNTSSWTVEDELTLTDYEVRAAAFAPDGKTLVFGDVKGGLYCWSFENKVNIKSGFNTPRSFGAVLCVLFAPDGKTLVTIHQSESNGTVMIWNMSTWVAKLEYGFCSAAFSKDGKVLALGGRNIKLVDPASWKHIRTIELPETTLSESGPGLEKQPNADKKIPIIIRALAFSPDGNTLAVGCMGPLRIVNMGQ